MLNEIRDVILYAYRVWALEEQTLLIPQTFRQILLDNPVTSWAHVGPIYHPGI